MRFLARHAPPAALFIIATTLLTWRLGAIYLWQDEAATAVLAERMLAHGKPLAYDGRNLITMDSFADEDLATIDRRAGDRDEELRYLVARGDFKADTAWIGQPWGQFVAAALSLKFLGHGTWQARLPFALAALATVVLLYRMALRVFEDRGVALAAGALLAGNAYWILHARQCRYYALSSLGLTLTLAAFLRWQRGARWGAAAFVASAWIYFQCDFGSFFPAAAVLAVVAGAAAWPRVGRVAATFAALAAAVAPFVWYYALFGRVRAAFDTFRARLTGNLFNVNEFVVAFAILAVAVALLWRERAALAPQRRMLLGASIAIVPATVLWVSAVAPASFLRYVIGLAPLGALVTAWTARRLAGGLARAMRAPRLEPLAFAALALLAAATGIASAPVSAPLAKPDEAVNLAWRRELATAGREIFVPRPDPNRQVIEAIAPLLRPGDEILVNYEDIPFMFYTDAVVRGGIAAFRVEDRQGPPPRFLVMRRSAWWVHWPAFEREASRFRWRQIATGAPDVPFGNCPDPHQDRPRGDAEIVVGERVGT